MAGRVTVAEVEQLVEPGELDPTRSTCPGSTCSASAADPGQVAEKRIERRTVPGRPEMPLTREEMAARAARSSATAPT